MNCIDLIGLNALKNVFPKIYSGLVSPLERTHALKLATTTTKKTQFWKAFADNSCWSQFWKPH